MTRFAVSGPAVVVPARVALLLGQHLKLDDLRVAVRGRDSEVDEVLLDWHLTELAYREQMAEKAAACDVASALPSRSQVVGESPRRSQQFGSRQVADVAGLKSTAAVTLAARERRLRGTHDGVRWWFEEDDVAAWLATRPA